MKSVVFRYIHYYNLCCISFATGSLPTLIYREQYLRTAAQTVA